MAARGGNTRFRGSSTTSPSSKDTDKPDNDTEKLQGQRRFLGEHICFLLLISYFVFFGIVSYGHRRLPTPKTNADYSMGNLTFIEERAYSHLKKITSFGPRPAGSKANEEKAVNYLLKELDRIKASASGAHKKIEIDVQRPEGSFTFNILAQPLTHYYKHVTNIVVRMGSARRTKGRARALLINGHFDTVPGSPGASDDAVSCAIMLEILEVLSKRTQPLDNDLILLFNGAEENVLQASHGFITQHPWAKDIDAFINLEAAGAGGRELVFQTGPEHPWLVRVYSEYAAHPFAAVVAQEIFQANLIPSDTDFRIFRDFGKIPGLDIAFISNGYVYHTKYDNLASIQPGCIQRAGDNVLSISHHLLTSDEMERGWKEELYGQPVFFDILGFFIISLPTRSVTYMVWSLLAAAIGMIIMRDAKGFHGRPYFVSVIQAVLVILLSWVAGLVAIIFMGVIVSSFSRHMFWFSNPGPILGIYAAPALYAIIRVQRGLGLKMHKNTKAKTSNPWLAECMFFDAYVVIWSSLLALCAYAGLSSAYIPFFWLFFPVAIRQTVWKYIKAYRQEVLGDYTVLGIYLLMVSMPVIMSFYLLWVGLEVFIPIMGRSGSQINPEIFIGAFAFVGVIINTSYLTSLIQTFKTLKYTRAFLLGLFLTSTLAMFTSLGFPYSGDPMNPAPKRSYLQHTSRTYYDYSGYLSYEEDSFLGVAPMDYLGVAPLFSDIPELKDAPEAGCDPEVPYCGLPYWVPVRSMLKKIWKLPAEPPKVPVPMNIKLVTKIEDKSKTRFEFNITAPDHMSVYISPRAHVNMTKWSMSKKIPKRNPNGVGGYAYIIHYGGGKPQDSWPLWIELEAGESHISSEPILDIAFAGQYKADFKYTPEIKDFLRRQPDWHFSVPIISTYFAYVY
ncbi:endoplasmic reticulum metallopeptidase 1-like [Amphiura filiformis]|uniref:endoplasmic reticulum metallopeptidase 1-like n=1 Tax=Amphiura filiformis TaxID=82378 RepID=UPI003B226F06